MSITVSNIMTKLSILSHFMAADIIEVFFHIKADQTNLVFALNYSLVLASFLHLLLDVCCITLYNINLFSMSAVMFNSCVKHEKLHKAGIVPDNLTGINLPVSVSTPTVLNRPTLPFLWQS